jgi:two-component system chemotaxis response regulator CheB
MAYQIVAVGTSLGGFHALGTVLGALPKDFPLPIAVVQHRSCEDTGSLTQLLANQANLPVVEVDDKEQIREGYVYVCPANYHLLVENGHFALSADAPVQFARPSIDVLFESVAEVYGESVVGVLLTGMSKDGAAGLKRIKEGGGYAVVQDPAEARGQVMPQTAIEAVPVDKILQLEQIAPFLTALCDGQRTRV